MLTSFFSTMSTRTVCIGQIRQFKSRNIDAPLLRRILQCGAAGFATALDLGELADDLPVAAIQIGFNGLPLRVEAKTTSALPRCTDPVLGDEFTAVRCHNIPSNGR
jgi:hypothetical protein